MDKNTTQNLNIKGKAISCSLYTQTGLTVLYSPSIIWSPFVDLAITFSLPGVPSSICSTYNIRKKNKNHSVSNKDMQMYLCPMTYPIIENECLTMTSNSNIHSKDTFTFLYICDYYLHV